LTKTNSVNHC